MSSKHKSSRWSKRSDYYPSEWSEWTWNEQYQRDARYRKVSEGNWEWEYGEYVEPTPRATLPLASLPAVDEFDPSEHYSHEEGLADFAQRLEGLTIASYAEGQQYSAAQHYPAEQQYPADPQYPAGEYNQEYFQSSKTYSGNIKGTETKCPECSMTFPRSTELERHQKTVHLNNGVRRYECHVPDCPANVRSWTTMRGLRLHEKNWHGPHTCSVPGCSRRHPFGFSSEADLEVHQVEHNGDLQPDKGRDERYWRKGKGSSYKGPDTSYDNQNYASEAYPEAEGKQQPFQDSSPPEGNAHPEPSYGPRSYSSTNPGHQQQSSYTSYSTVPLPATPSRMRKITAGNPELSFDHLDKRFKVHRSTDFQFGRVFKVLWSEPVGSHGTEITIQAPFGERAYHKVRRFLIVSERNKGHSICIPILTYANQGVLKRGVHPEDHAVVYTDKKNGPCLLHGEEGLMTKDPIRIEMITPAEKLDQLSRLNFAKLYTVEHNIKVFFIGRVAKIHERALMEAYNETHPPFDPGPVSYMPKDDKFDLAGMAEQDNSQYQFAATPIPTGTSYSSSQSYPYAEPTYVSTDATAYTEPPYSGPSYVSTDATAYTATPSSSQTAQAANYSAYDDAYDSDDSDGS